MITRRSLPSLPLLPVLLLHLLLAAAAPAAKPPFKPADSFLLDCGATTRPDLPDGRQFKPDPESASFLSSPDELRVETAAAPGVPSPLYLSARVFTQDSSYAFPLTQPGWHWIRLHFFPVHDRNYNLSTAVFSVKTDDLVLLHSFSINDPTKWVLKEYLVNVTTERLAIRFFPQRNSLAYINAIEVVSAPNDLIPNTVPALFPVGQRSDIDGSAFQTVQHINVGGPLVTPANDTLGRTWVPDRYFLIPKPENDTDPLVTARYEVSAADITYPEGNSPEFAPRAVYGSAAHMAESNTSGANFNVTWQFPVDQSFGYLVRLHFCDIISVSRDNPVQFNVYINSKMAIPALDLLAATGSTVLKAAYYQDFVLNSSLARDRITVQITSLSSNSGQKDAVLNGVEILKMSNSVGSLDGEFGVDGTTASMGEGGAGSGRPKRVAVAAMGAVMFFGAFFGLAAMVRKWHKRPRDWERRNSFSSWLLPIHAGHSTFMHSKGGGTSAFGSKSGYSFSSALGLGRYFSLAELQEATKNFDQKVVIGVGGFGNVYLGELDDGRKVAVKRGNPQSEQGINEFQTEIQMLSKLRHRHLVSLIGYCDENSEMILVYEYMANGPLRDHLYGKDGLMPLTWKQRLEVCIGAARGLHYLHTGTAQGIIHRDVKTTNILLDDDFTAKMSDFGLSKDAPGMDQTHVSTAVKGSFGYLDPEYFRSQRLTDKSDVYSFGVVLLEALCARPALHPALPREQVNLAEWAMKCKRNGVLDTIVDPLLEGTVNPDSMNKFIEAAEKCLAEFGVDRPSMGDVLWTLEYALQLQEANPPMPSPAHSRKPSVADAVAANVSVNAEASARENSGNDVFPQLLAR